MRSACSAHTLKIGIMDEERRTTVNLKACIRAARDRVVLHQYRLPRPHRRRDPHRMEAGPMIRKGDMKTARLDPGLRGPQRRHRPRLRPAGPGPDRQGHVGHARQDGGRCWSQDRPSEGRRQHRLGALADRGDAACPALPPGRRRGPPGGAEVAAARQPRRHPDDPAGRAARTGRRTRSSASSTTTPRASWAMSCAGSTRASAAPRCPTSTMSA